MSTVSIKRPRRLLALEPYAAVYFSLKVGSKLNKFGYYYFISIILAFHLYLANLPMATASLKLVKNKSVNQFMGLILVNFLL